MLLAKISTLSKCRPSWMFFSELKQCVKPEMINPMYVAFQTILCLHTLADYW